MSRLIDKEDTYSEAHDNSVYAQIATILINENEEIDKVRYLFKLALHMLNKNCPINAGYAKYIAIAILSNCPGILNPLSNAIAPDITAKDDLHPTDYILSCLEIYGELEGEGKQKYAYDFIFQSTIHY